MPAASCSVSVDTSVAMTTTSSVDADSNSGPLVVKVYPEKQPQEPKEGPSSSPRLVLSPPPLPMTLDLDDAVFLIDPVAGILQGIVTHLGCEDDDENVGIQLTGSSLGKGNGRKRSRPSSYSSRRPQQTRPDWSVHIANKNFTSRPIERVYKRFATSNGPSSSSSSSKLSIDDEVITAFVEQRQSSVKTDHLHMPNTNTSQTKSRPWNLFKKRQPTLCQQDLDFLEKILSTHHSIAFCLWDALESTITLASPAFLQLTGYSLQRILGRNLDVLTGPQTNVAHTTAWKEALGQTGNCHMVILHYRPVEEFFFHRMFLSPLSSENHEIRYYLSLHSQVSATEAARINHREGWPMPAIFNLKGSSHHPTTLNSNESATNHSGNLETQQPTHQTTVDMNEHQTVESVTPKTEDTAIEPNRSSTESDGNIHLPNPNGEYDVSAWLPEFSFHDAKTPKKVKKHGKKKKSNNNPPTETLDLTLETPSLESTASPSETEIGEFQNPVLENPNNSDSPLAKTSIAAQSETKHRKMSTSKKDTKKKRHSTSSKRNSMPNRNSIGEGGNHEEMTPSTPRRGRSNAPKEGRESPQRSFTPRREGSKTRRAGMESPMRNSTPLRRNSSPRSSRQPNQHRLLSPKSQPNPSSPTTRKIDLVRQKSIGDLHDLLFSQPSSLSATHHTITSLTTEQTPVVEDSTLDYEPVTVAPRTPSKAIQNLSLQHENWDFVTLLGPDLHQKEVAPDESKNTLPRRSSTSFLKRRTSEESENSVPRRSSAPLLEGKTNTESQSASPRRKGERRKSTDSGISSPRRRSSTESGNGSPRRRRSVESGRVSSRKRISAEVKRSPSRRSSSIESERQSPQRSFRGSHRRRKSGESAQKRRSEEKAKITSGESETIPRTSPKVKKENTSVLKTSFKDEMSPRRKVQPGDVPDCFDGGKQSKHRGPHSRQGIKKHLPSQTQNDESDSSSSSEYSGPNGQINLLRDSSIGDLHDLLFSQSASLSGTHHSTTSYTEEESLVLDVSEAMVMSPKPPPSPQSLLDTVHSINSISEVHDLLYSQRNLSMHTVTTLSEADPSLVEEYNEAEPLSPVDTQHTSTSISDVHNVLYSQPTGLSTATEHSIPASTLSNE